MLVLKWIIMSPSSDLRTGDNKHWLGPVGLHEWWFIRLMISHGNIWEPIWGDLIELFHQLYTSNVLLGFFPQWMKQVDLMVKNVCFLLRGHEVQIQRGLGYVHLCRLSSQIRAQRGFLVSQTRGSHTSIWCLVRSWP